MGPGSPSVEKLATQCCIAGGGPAGMMLGFLLARAGVKVLVLEKHRDFLRDFRGDTIHPSTLELMHELGILDDFLSRPHQELKQLGAQIDGYSAIVADFSRIKTHCKFIALMPQWDFLDFIAGRARRYPGFQLRMQAEVIALLEEGGRVVGVTARTPEGTLEVRADLVVGADGRRSQVRASSGLRVIDSGAPIDVLWMRVSRRSSDPPQTLGRFHAGRLMVTLNRGDYWQCAYVVAKGTLQEIQQKGLDSFREDVATVAPFLRDRVDEIATWDDVKLLSVTVDHLQHWSRDGLLCIGDAAHAMSPIGGVGINLAIQDAVAAANLLTAAFSHGRPTVQKLRAVQRRRAYPARMTQRFQVFAHRRLLAPALARKTLLTRAPFALRMLQWIPFLRRIAARMVGLGFRPEHIHTPDVLA